MAFFIPLVAYGGTALGAAWAAWKVNDAVDTVSGKSIADNVTKGSKLNPLKVFLWLGLGLMALKLAAGTKRLLGAK